MGTFTQTSFNMLSATANQITGTYKVNPDCTGTARLTTGTGASRATRNINFVLTRDVLGVTGTFRPVLNFVFADTATTGGGVAKQQ